MSRLNKSLIGVFVLLLAVFMGKVLAAESAELAQARSYAGKALAFMDKYYDAVAMSGGGPTSVEKSQGYRENARDNAEKALRRFEAAASSGSALPSSDLVLSGKCRLVVLDPALPSSQSEEERATILSAALKDFSEAWKIDGGNASAWAGQMDANRLMRAEKAGDAMIGRVPSSVSGTAEWNVAVGRFYLEMDRINDAMPFLDKAWDKGGGAREGLYLAVGRYMSDDFEGARKSAYGALEDDEGLEAARLVIEHLDAVKEARSGTAAQRIDSSRLAAAGVAFEQRGDYRASRRFFQTSVQVTPDDPRVLYYLGVSMAYSSKAEANKADASQAAEYLSKSLANGGPPGIARHAAMLPLAMAQETAGDLSGAAHTYSEIIEADPENYRVYFDFARVLRSMGKTEEADRAEEKGSSLKPRTTFGSAAAKEEALEIIGEIDQCDAPARLDKGKALIRGRVTAAGRGLSGAEVQLILDGCSRATTPVQAGTDGSFTVSLPPGNYVYNGLRIINYPRPSEPALSDLVYVPGALEDLYDFTNLTGPPGSFKAVEGDNGPLAFEAGFVERLEVLSPHNGQSISFGEARDFELKWRPAKGASHYEVDLYKIEGDGGGGRAMTVMTEGARFDRNEAPLGDISKSMGTMLEPGRYGMVVKAVGGGEVEIGRSPGLVEFSLD